MFETSCAQNKRAVPKQILFKRHPTPTTSPIQTSLINDSISPNKFLMSVTQNNIKFYQNSYMNGIQTSTLLKVSIN